MKTKPVPARQGVGAAHPVSTCFMRKAAQPDTFLLPVETRAGRPPMDRGASGLPWVRIGRRPVSEGPASREETPGEATP